MCVICHQAPPRRRRTSDHEWLRLHRTNEGSSYFLFFFQGNKQRMKLIRKQKEALLDPPFSLLYSGHHVLCVSLAARCSCLLSFFFPLLRLLLFFVFFSSLPFNTFFATYFQNNSVSTLLKSQHFPKTTSDISSSPELFLCLLLLISILQSHRNATHSFSLHNTHPTPPHSYISKSNHVELWFHRSRSCPTPCHGRPRSV